MKRILITGKNSYVGNSFAEWVSQYPDKYEVDKISLRNDDWKKKDFSKYDVVLHVAGIAHRKEKKRDKDLYFRVNRDLAYEVAKKAKKEGVSQFIFLSSMSVYGMETGVITRDTVPQPKSLYGKSKLEAEKLIEHLNDQTFKVAILRPPMVYGKGCKGNYPKLAKLAKITPLFPDIDNKRSMIFVDNLSKFLKVIIDNNQSGLFFPQNNEYVNTSELVELIAKYNNKKIKLTKLFNPIINSLKFNSTVKKIFGTLIYEKNISINLYQYVDFVDLKESVKLTEDNNEKNYNTF